MDPQPVVPVCACGVGTLLRMTVKGPCQPIATHGHCAAVLSSGLNCGRCRMPPGYLGAVKSVAVESGIRFTELECELDYLSTDKHRHGGTPQGKADHSSWSIERPAEAQAFSAAAVGAGVSDNQGNLWYAERSQNRLRVFGTADEKVALFQQPSGGQGDWHGHPRGHRGREDYPDTATLRRLKDAGAISNVEYGRMISGSIP